jgi:glycosyltransferase involved in cell wall biosynthesis
VRICFVSRRYWPAVSGMSVYAENLLRELVALGHDVTLVAQYRDDPVGRGVYGGGPPPPDRVPAGVRVVGAPSVGETAAPADFEGDVARLVATIEELSDPARGGAPFDVLHAQYGYPPGLAVLEASRRLGVPNVVSIQGGDGHWVGTCCTTHKAAITTVLDRAQAVLIGSESFAEEVIGLHGTARERFTVVGGATDCARFVPTDAPPPADEPVLIYHGRVDRRKGVLDLLDALPLLRTPVRLVVSGIGPDLEEVRRRVTDLPPGRVELTGYAAYDDAPAVYRRGSVFVSPTYSEGFSNTVLEAMACGLPVVSTRVVGVVDCLRDGENGLLVEPGDPPALAAALDRLLTDRELYTRIRGQALREVREQYSWPVLAGRIDDVYRELVTTKPDGALLPGEAFGEGGVDPSCRFRAAPHLL